MDYAIALSGGGTRGAAHVGVMCALEEADILPRAVSGTSAGSIVAGLYASGMKPSRMRREIETLSKAGRTIVDVDYAGIVSSLVRFILHKSVTLPGFLKGDKLEAYLNELTGGVELSQLTMKTVITAVDLYSRKTIAYVNTLDDVQVFRNVIWRSDVRLSEAMRASCAVPAYFRPKMTDGMCLVDGGVTDVVPVDLLIAAGEQRVLGVDVSANYPLDRNANFIEISNQSLSVLMACLSEYRASGEKLMLIPKLPEAAGLLTFDQMLQCMDVGYEETKKSIPLIKSIFSA